MTIATAIGAFALTVSGQPGAGMTEVAPELPLVLISDYVWLSRSGMPGQPVGHSAIVVSSSDYAVSPEVDVVLRKAVNAGLEHKYFL